MLRSILYVHTVLVWMAQANELYTVTEVNRSAPRQVKSEVCLHVLYDKLGNRALFRMSECQAIVVH